MKNVIVTGANGQDGSYLCEILLSKGFHVIGTVRSKNNSDLTNLNSIVDQIEIVDFDLFDTKKIEELIGTYNPSQLYNLAAYSSSHGALKDEDVALINAVAVVRMLAAIHKIDPNIRFCQASSSEIYGGASTSPQCEKTMPAPVNSYGAAKLYAQHMIKMYRDEHKIFACSAILYNHESPRRGSGFVTKKIAKAAASISLGLSKEFSLGNLEAHRDWGYARDYVEAMVMMLERNIADDYIVATGESNTVARFCEIAFSYLGLDYKDFVRIDNRFYRPDQKSKRVGNIHKIESTLGWRPSIKLEALVKMMVDEELKLLTNNKYKLDVRNV